MDLPYPDGIPPNPPPRTRQPPPTAPSAYDTYVNIEPSIRRDDYHNRPYQAKYLKHGGSVYDSLYSITDDLEHRVSGKNVR